MSTSMWFSGWDDVARVAISGTVTFVALLVMIRLGGSRTLASMNASDFIVTVAIGTTFATTMLSSEVAVVSGLVAVATLIGIQTLTVWLSVKYPALRHRAEGEPIVLLKDGVPMRAVMDRTHVSMDELRQAVREQGFGTFEEVAVVLLETNGKFSVVPRQKQGDANAIPHH